MASIFIRIILALTVVSLIALVLTLAGTNPQWRAFKSEPQDTIETAMPLRNPTIRQTVFGRLDHVRDVDYYTFRVQEPSEITVTLRTPVADKAFNPVITLFGSGLPRPNEDPTIPIGDQNGAIVGRIGRDTRRSSFDLQLLTSFYEGATVTTRIPHAGTYAIAITSPTADQGRYVMSMGHKSSRTIDAWSSYVGGTMIALLRLY